MKPLTAEQAERLFKILDTEGDCPGMFFGDSCHTAACPHNGESGGEECSACIREAIATLRVVQEDEK